MVIDTQSGENKNRIINMTAIPGYSTLIAPGMTFSPKKYETVGKQQYLRALNDDAAAYVANPDEAPTALLVPVLAEAKRLTCEASACATDEQIALEILAQTAE